MSQRSRKRTKTDQTTVAPIHLNDIHRSLLEALPHAVVLLCEDNRVSYANPAAESFFGLSLAVLRRQEISALFLSL